MEVRFLQPEEFHKTASFFEGQAVPPLDPQWAKVIAAINDDGEVVGIMCLQLVAHAEPIMIRKDYRGQDLWRQMAEMLDGYLWAVGIPGIYTQPTNATAEALTAKMGFSKAEFPLWVKTYDLQIDSLMPTEKED